MRTYKRQLNVNLLKGNNNENIWKHLPERENYFLSASGRGGLEACVDILKLKKNDTVLLPIFIAEGAISPFIKKNIPIKFYHCNWNLTIDITKLKEIFESTSSIKAILIVHYFGFPQPIYKIQNLCIKYEIIIIEDCAQALFSRDKNGLPLGSLGDISFFSLPKTIPVPDGCIVFAKNEYFIKTNNGIKYKKSMFHLFSVAFMTLYLLIKQVETKLTYSIFQRAINLIEKMIYASYYQSLRLMKKPAKISSLTRKIVKNINYQKIIKRRLENIKYFYDNIDQKKYRLVYPEYNENYICTGIPLLVKNRDKFTKTLIKKNIECLQHIKRWFYLLDNLNQEFVNETEFFNKHVLIPVSENIAIHDMKNIVEILNNLGN